ncbi:Uncharacterised protein [Bordetella ansorpii]|uniref:Uncharacterized protein n=1 Tax=Bordetella ansorpii TaxID=288768 RepID=A0A157S8I1_9BORD|nr:hypothetical protein [Bordetella ansorpii]SAI66704.1 Uncharacterised protein [Bordetella ansorpii]
MKTYLRVSLGVGILMMAVWLGLYANTPFASGRDGQGPSEAGMLLFFATIALSLALAHATIVTLGMSFSKLVGPLAKEGKIGMGLCAVMWIVMAVCLNLA